MTNQSEFEFLSELLRRHDEAQRLASIAYSDLQAQKLVRKKTIGEWWCERKGCLLAVILVTERKVLVHIPAYKLSPERLEEESNAEGRAANMNAQGYWSPQTFWFTESLGDEWQISAHCSHVECRITAAEIVDLTQTQTPGKPKKHAIGSS